MDYELMMNGNVKIGQKAPEFTATTTFGEISLKDYEEKWLVLFSHPRRFYPCMLNFQTLKSVDITVIQKNKKLKYSKKIVKN